MIEGNSVYHARTSSNNAKKFTDTEINQMRIEDTTLFRLECTTSTTCVSYFQNDRAWASNGEVVQDSYNGEGSRAIQRICSNSSSGPFADIGDHRNLLDGGSNLHTHKLWAAGADCYSCNDNAGNDPPSQYENRRRRSTDAGDSAIRNCGAIYAPATSQLGSECSNNQRYCGCFCGVWGGSGTLYIGGECKPVPTR